MDITHASASSLYDSAEVIAERDIYPEPPPPVMHRARKGGLTPDDVRANSAYFFCTNEGQALAQPQRCEHNYGLLDSCPCCDQQDNPQRGALADPQRCEHGYGLMDSCPCC